MPETDSLLDKWVDGWSRDFTEILTNPFLDIAARFWDQQRYLAFRVFYRSMRLIDDVVDDFKVVQHGESSPDAEQVRRLIRNWLCAVEQRRPQDAAQMTFVETLEKYEAPLWPWERLCRAMEYDLAASGFPSLLSFLRYSEGAAIAPAAVFMHLCGLTQDGRSYQAPRYDIRQAARPLAIFSYLVHIMRDFRKDQLEGLNYFAEDILERRGLTSAELRHTAESGTITPDFRSLIEEYLGFAAYYRKRAREVIDTIAPMLQSRYLLSVELIYSLYSLVLERITAGIGQDKLPDFNPGPSELRERIENTVLEFSKR
jgi:phytoene/squalene synthetase